MAKYIAALHEAAHAVTAYLFGMEITVLDIIAD
jgi:hypothetical protein